MDVSVNLFGLPVITVDGIAHQKFRSHRVPAMIAYLATHQGVANRIACAEALWPSVEPSVSTQNLRQTLLYARKLIGAGAIISSGSNLVLSPDLMVDRFEWTNYILRVPSEFDSDVSRRWLLAAARSEFMLGFADEWITEERQRIHKVTLEVLTHHGKGLLSKSPSAALEVFSDIIALDAMFEPAVKAQAEALRLLNRKVDAARTERTYARAVETDFQLANEKPDSSADHPVSSEIPSISDAISMFLRLRLLSEAEELLIASVEFLVRRGTPLIGLEWLDRIAESDRDGKSVNEARLKFARAKLLEAVGRLTESLKWIEDLLAMSPAPNLVARAYVLKSRIELQMFRTTEAQRSLRKVSALQADDQMTREMLRAQVSEVNATLLMQDFAQCERLGQSVARLCRKHNEPGIEIAVLVAVVRAQLRLGKDFSGTLREIEICEQSMAKSLLSLNGLARMGVGRVKEEAGDIDGALADYERGIALVRTTDDAFGLAVALTYLGDIYERLGDADRAIRFHREALDIRIPIVDKLGLACTHRGLARAYLRSQQLDQSLSHVLKSASLFQDVGDMNGYVSAVLILATVYQAQDDAKRSLRAARHGLKLLEDLGPGATEEMGPTFAMIAQNVRAIVADDV